LKRLVLVLLPLLLAACTPNTPEGIAKAYLSALAQGQFERASQVVTPEARSVLLSIQSSYLKLSPPEQEKFRLRDWRVDKMQVNGDSAEVDFSYAAHPKEKGRIQAHLWLLKENGVWQVDLKPPL
jgi:hypothetical protein